MNHKKIMAAFLFLVFIGALAFANAANAESLGFKIRLYGGLGYLSGGDLNDGLQGFPAMYTDLAHAVGSSISGQYSGAHLGPVFGGDFILQITPRFGIGLGTGYVQATKDSVLTITAATGFESIKTVPSLHAIPLKLSFFFSVPAGRMTVNFHAGVGYYLAKASADLRLEGMGDWEELLSETGTKGGIGFHGGIGFEFNVASHVALFVEAQGQYVSISGFDGTLTVTASGGVNSLISGTLYYFEQKTLAGNYYPMIFIGPMTPSGPGVRNVREAKVDFSGGELVAGIAFKF